MNAVSSPPQNLTGKQSPQPPLVAEGASIQLEDAWVGISTSLAPLREVAESLRQAQAGQLPQGSHRQRLKRRVRQAGAAALPSLIKNLLGGHDTAASWAYQLLLSLASPDKGYEPASLRELVIDRLGPLLQEGRLGDAVKLRIIDLLGELRVELPSEVVLQDPDAMLKRTVTDLLAGLDSATAIHEAVDLILTQVPEDELPGFLKQVTLHGGERALPLLAELLTDIRLPRELALSLSQLVRPSSRPLLPKKPTREQTLDRLERALQLMHEGKLGLAHKRLVALCATSSDESAVQSALGLCLLKMDEPAQALPFLQRASELEPLVAVHAWNIATAAQSAEQSGTCYHALMRYLQTPDQAPGADERYLAAQQFCDNYQAKIEAEYPGMPLSKVLQGEALFEQAYSALRAARYDVAIAGFQQVLQQFPQHHPSWGNLGLAYEAQQRTREAARCFRRALRIRPGYQLARNHLSLLTAQ